MRVTRRSFLATSSHAGAGTALGFLGMDLSPTVAYASKMAAAVKRSRITTTLCPYCAVGCGALVMTEQKDGQWQVVNVEGDPDHPINEGTLCPKGAALVQMANNENGDAGDG